MKKTRMAMMAVALVAGMSSMVFAQGRGGGRGGGQQRPAYTALMMGIALSATDSAKLHPIDSIYQAARRTAMGMGAGGAGGRGQGGGAPAPMADTTKAKLAPAVKVWEDGLRAALAPDQQKIFDTNLKTFDPYAPQGGGRRGGGGK